jgi:hypothetical protein
MSDFHAASILYIILFFPNYDCIQEADFWIWKSENLLINICFV